MKLWSATIASLLQDEELRRSGRPVIKFLLLLGLIVTLYSVLFHVIMINAEGQQHPWFAGPYFVLVTMSTLGFGDLVFHSTLGRFYAVFVLMSGLILLLTIMPFLFVRLVYLPWLTAHNKHRIPRSVGDDVEDHVLICGWDSLAQGLVQRLKVQKIRYFVIEPDPAVASRLHDDGFEVVLSDRDSKEAFESLGARRARLVVANLSDAENTNVAITLREVAPEVPLLAFVDRGDAIDILQLAGATQAVCLKTVLGDHLALRVNAGNAQAHVFGYFHNLQLAEFSAHRTPLAGKTVRETKLREVLGLRILAIWERGRLMPARPDTAISNQSVLVLLGTEEQMAALDELMIIYDPNPNPVVVLGGGQVGRATAWALRRRQVPVHIVEKDLELAEAAREVADKVIVGDASELRVLEAAGIHDAPSVVLTTHDDAINIYLAVYCRRLNPELRITSRITHERNVESVHRAGADLVLSHASLGVGITMAALQGQEAVLIGEGIDLFTIALPPFLEGLTLAESAIGERSGLNIIAVREGERVTENPPADFVLNPGCELVALGTPEHLQAFNVMAKKEKPRHHPKRDRAA